MKLGIFKENQFSMKALTYRKYSQAYFEEIIINNNVDVRIAQEFRKKFVKTP